jgi:outer membrane protein TolC
VDAAAEQLRAEKVRLEHGESTPFDVLERERDFVDSESQRIGAFQLYHSSVAGLNRAQGTTLKNRNVIFEEAARLR